MQQIEIHHVRLIYNSAFRFYDEARIAGKSKTLYCNLFTIDLDHILQLRWLTYLIQIMCDTRIMNDGGTLSTQIAESWTKLLISKGNGTK